MPRSQTPFFFSAKSTEFCRFFVGYWKSRTGFSRRALAQRLDFRFVQKPSAKRGQVFKNLRQNTAKRLLLSLACDGRLAHPLHVRPIDPTFKTRKHACHKMEGRNLPSPSCGRVPQPKAASEIDSRARIHSRRCFAWPTSFPVTQKPDAYVLYLQVLCRLYLFVTVWETRSFAPYPLCTDMAWVDQRSQRAKQ